MAIADTISIFRLLMKTGIPGMVRGFQNFICPRSNFLLIRVRLESQTRSFGPYGPTFWLTGCGSLKGWLWTQWKTLEEKFYFRIKFSKKSKNIIFLSFSNWITGAHDWSQQSKFIREVCWAISLLSWSDLFQSSISDHERSELIRLSCDIFKMVTWRLNQELK